jgi:MoxR-like ATPase
MVIATQNPVEYHGTYPLPESQLDRFLMRIEMGYPDAASEREILRTHGHGQEPAVDNLQAVVSGEDLAAVQRQVEQVRVDEAAMDYLMAIVERTRQHEHLALGVSPRGSIALYRAAQALAYTEGLDYITPHHIKRLVIPVFAHRVTPDTRFGGPSGTASRGAHILDEILHAVDVPL